ncbi:MAG: hypothetical protein IKM20_04275 [Erysipelotrichales bacterium]|nr:hypothetical protein [Erysipelotrichales bacterium]
MNEEARFIKHKNIDKILNDIESKLSIKVGINDLIYYTEGATDSIVFSIANKYLVKTVDSLTFKSQLAFLDFYKDIECFQKVVCCNEDLQYICFEFIDGIKLVNSELDAHEIVRQIYSIVNEYKEYDYEYYGYLYEDKKSWYEFLNDEVKFSDEIIKQLDMSFPEVSEALESLKAYTSGKYLLHGDFGAHNFLVSDSKLKVIDPMPVVGDYLYDFYFAVFSDLKVFKDIDYNELLVYFGRDIKTKRNIMLIAFYIRLARCYAYTIDDFDEYLNYYNILISNKYK